MISKFKREFLECLEYSKKVLIEHVEGYKDAERVFKGAALTLYYVEKYAHMLGYKMQSIDMERAAYVGGLIDPYDSIIDKGTIDEAVASCARYFRLLNTGEFTPANGREHVFLSLYSALTKMLPQKEHDDFYTILAVMNMVESVAILQKRGSGYIIGISDRHYASPLSDDLLCTVMEMKGGMSFLLFSSLIDENIQIAPGFNQQELGSKVALKQRILDYVLEGKPLFELQTARSKLIYSMGNFVQAMDDLRDVNEDCSRNLETFTQRVGTLKSFLTAKIYRNQMTSQISHLFNKEQSAAFLMYSDFYFARTIGVAVKREALRLLGIVRVCQQFNLTRSPSKIKLRSRRVGR
jgi:hypothetical protein